MECSSNGESEEVRTMSRPSRRRAAAVADDDDGPDGPTIGSRSRRHRWSCRHKQWPPPPFSVAAGSGSYRTTDCVAAADGDAAFDRSAS